MNLQEWLERLTKDLKPDLNECILYLGDFFPLLKEFKNTIQDPIWHSEGNVHIHTNMVLKELYQIKNFELFPGNLKRTLILSALLHDIAKPITTFTCKETGRVKASKHEEKGKNYLVFKLLELNLPKDEYLSILNLVGYHQKPKLAVIKNLSRNEYFKMNALFDPYLMYYLEKADMLGRTCNDLDEQLMYLDEYFDLALKYKDEFKETESIAHTNYEYYVGSYALKEGLIYSPEEIKAKYFNHKDNHAHAIILCGISGTGKSTYIKSHFSDYKIISMDEIRAELCGNRRDQSKNSEVAQLAKERFKEALRNKEKVVWDATNTRKEFREQLYTVAHNYNALTELHVLLAKESIIRKRNKEREFDVPDEIITKQINQFQFPDVNETHKVKYTIIG